jgi:hypothetical protein
MEECVTDSRTDGPSPNAGDADHARRRRQVLTIAFSTVLMACGGGGAGSDSQAPGAPGAPTPSPNPPGSAWNVGALFLTTGTAATFDLASTLPSGVAHGGVFEVSASGSPLPNGMTLSPAGILAVGSAATGEVSSGVVFSYSEPGR